MLRSFLLSLAAFILIGGAFALYWLSQPRVLVTGGGRPMVFPTTAPTDLTQMQIGPGHRAWINSYQGGRLASQFSADEFTPIGGNLFDVRAPVSRFYAAGGQLIILTGKTGTVYVDPGHSSGDQFAVATAQMPNRGHLKDVRIELYPTVTSTSPTEVMRTDNIAFDNDTLRIFTEKFTDASGANVPADRVPVTVRGEEYDFDGQGLVLRWNDRDSRIQLLEIAHGEKLVVKDTKKVSTPWTTPAIAPAPTEPAPTMRPVVASTVPPQVHPTTPVAAPAPDAGPTLYHAVFDRNVSIYQDGRLTGTGDTMTVSFLSGHSATTPATHPAVASTSPSSQPATRPATTTAAATQPTTAPTPTTAIVLWTGKLRLTPMTTSTLPLPPKFGESVVQLCGRPATLCPLHATLSAASVTYRTGDGAAVVEPSTDVPLVDFADDRGANFVGDRIVYDPATAIATLSGPASLTEPVENQHGQTMTARWSGPGLLHVVPKAGQPDFVDHVDLLRDVVVTHPQFHLTSDELSLDLSRGPRTSATATPPTRVDRATAIGRAVCRVTRPGQPVQGIDGDRLTLLLQPDAAGKSSPHEVLADGHVLAFNPTQKLIAGHLDAVLAENSDDDTDSGDDTGLAVQTVHATDAVHVELHSGAIADADELWLTTPNGHTQIDLHSPTAARVNDGKGSVVTGGHIRLLPDDSIARVLGPGTLDALRPAEKGEPPKRIHATWQNRLDVDQNANTVDADGSVTTDSKRPNGTVDAMTGDHAHADLMDAPPTTRPATRKATTSGAQSLASGKVVKAMNVKGHVVGTSILNSPDGHLLRQERLLADLLTYDAATGKIVVPGPGRLLSQDQRPPSTAPSADEGAGGRGITAVAWKRDATYTPADRQIVLRGDTLVAFSKTVQQAVPMRLASQRLTLDLAPPAKGASKSADTGTQVSHVTALHAVRFSSTDVDFTGHQVDYDPATGEMIAIGTETEPAEVERGSTTGRFRRLRYNVKTDEIEQVEGLSAGSP